MGMLRYTKALYGAIKENAQQSAQANRDAENKLRSSFGGSSTTADAERVAAETQRIKKERGVSFRASLRKRLNLAE